VTTKLDLFNGALLICGERFLNSLTEEREPRRLLDNVYDQQDGVKACLEEGQWYFAMRTVQIDYDSGIEPDFGYRRGFTKPDDWVITSAVCTDPYFRNPLLRYADEAGYWYSDLDTMYVRFVSDLTTYGRDMNKWPKKFLEFVEAHFASKIIHKIKNSEEERERVLKIRKDALREAKNNSLMAEPTKFPAVGSWVRSRNRFPGRRDGGPTGNLIG
jgi:hypothetical protein